MSIFTKIKKLFKKNIKPNQSKVSDFIESNLSNFENLEISDLMIPRTDIIAIDISSSFAELRDLFVKNRHTRIPVYKKNLDEILGFIHIKDLVLEDFKSEKNINSIIRELIYVPRSMKCIDLLVDMQKKGTQIAVVLDEYGGTEGIITIENLIENIVGDIKDEHEKIQIIAPITKDSKYVYTIDARANLIDVEKSLNIDLESDDSGYETFGGYVLSCLDRIPKKGEKFQIAKVGIEVQIVDATERKIKLLKVKKKLNDD